MQILVAPDTCKLPSGLVVTNTVHEKKLHSDFLFFSVLPYVFNFVLKPLTCYVSKYTDLHNNCNIYMTKIHSF